ncbi:MAG: FadR/GntR family transcriptional regulator [Serratia proteamaculans]|jgi:DNA-binding FadR family transcriptional regulator|uniref:FCD domain-containing protein n=1 Tax=Serratia proteamaculans TaxID=28151 RepID=A0A4Q4LI86_SERPR|nr:MULTISPECIES: FadR/GntR family transcriptional regulator [Serratia]SPZ55187.1 L-lactate utilization operon repressor [Serratia quinivorans]HCV63995.1 FadR family transcriptional regulator [Serratia sp. (in: enterobacteria)]KAB1493766.1 FadR family transcriptional regulator [Serratia proteamaculans]MBI6182793.1 FadR family transcriptional regulator [Serratia proteamaculans]MBO1503897.1 FadR family transcriptional regulator [Serratia proteamaculans]
MQFNAQQQAAQRNLSYLLAEKLGQQILAGDYQAGSILPGEMELGEQFGVSRTAVREAVKMLAAKGMLLPRPRIGTRVMPQSQWNFLDQDLLTWWMTKENFDQVMQHFLILRTSLEPQACSLAAANANTQQTARLAELMAEMRALHIQFDREHWIQVDTQFHQLIYEASGNPFLTSFANLFSSVYQSYFRAITGNEVIKLQHHQAIVDAILAGDSAEALAACQVLLREKD